MQLCASGSFSAHTKVPVDQRVVSLLLSTGLLERILVLITYRNCLFHNLIKVSSIKQRETNIIYIHTYIFKQYNLIK